MLNHKSNVPFRILEVIPLLTYFGKIFELHCIEEKNVLMIFLILIAILQLYTPNTTQFIVLEIRVRVRIAV